MPQLRKKIFRRLRKTSLIAHVVFFFDSFSKFVLYTSHNTTPFDRLLILQGTFRFFNRILRVRPRKKRIKHRSIEKEKPRKRKAVLSYFLSLTFNRFNWTHCQLSSRTDVAKEGAGRRQGKYRDVSNHTELFISISVYVLHFSFWFHRPKHTQLQNSMHQCIILQVGWERSFIWQSKGLKYLEWIM